MSPPIEIDGTDISGATIDGTDVTEITVDGQTVFTAQTLPVAYSNLIAWYPFDSAEYGGNNADDVTALFNPAQSGDSTAYDGTVNGPTYQASGGGTDINAGANSGAFDFDFSDHIELGKSFLPSGSVAVWFFVDAFDSTEEFWFPIGLNSNNGLYFFNSTTEWGVRDRANAGDNRFSATSSFSTGQWNHFVWSTDGTNIACYLNGTKDTSTGSEGLHFEYIGTAYSSGGGAQFSLDGRVDDFRVYDKQLSQSEVNQMISNTPHP